MKRETQFWVFLIGILIALLLIVWIAPGWVMSDQSYTRQTVPTRTPTPVLEPRVYLPFVLKNSSNPAH